MFPPVVPPRSWSSTTQMANFLPTAETYRDLAKTWEIRQEEPSKEEFVQNWVLPKAHPRPLTTAALKWLEENEECSPQ